MLEHDSQYYDSSFSHLILLTFLRGPEVNLHEIRNEKIDADKYVDLLKVSHIIHWFIHSPYMSAGMNRSLRAGLRARSPGRQIHIPSTILGDSS